MKLLTLLIGSSLCISVFAQREVNTSVKGQVKEVSATESTPSTQEFSFQVNEEKLATKNQDSKKTVAYYDEYIAALEAKISLVQNNPVENANALENGWYKKMESYLKTARTERNALISQGK